MTRNPLINALATALYIVVVVSFMHSVLSLSSRSSSFPPRAWDVYTVALWAAAFDK